MEAAGIQEMTYNYIIKCYMDVRKDANTIISGSSRFKIIVIMIYLFQIFSVYFGNSSIISADIVLL